MANFKYEANNRQGNVAKGTITAANEEEANQKLRAQGLTPTSLKKQSKEIKLSLKRKVTAKDLKAFTRQFATMIDAGLPLVQCLDILGSQSENKWFGSQLLEIKVLVEGGSTFSDAMAKFPKVFDELFVALVAAGELGGILDTIMKRLAEYIEKKEALQRKVKGAMVYPIAITIIAGAVVVILMKWVIPTFEKMFMDFGGALPAPTQFVINISNAFQRQWYTFIGVTVGSVMGFNAIKRSRIGKQFLHRFYLWLPVIGTVTRKIAVARFTRTLGTLLSSGVPILEAMNTVSKAVGNVVIEKAILYARERISEGRNMSEPLQNSKIFPGMVIQMSAVGEQTGALDVMCNKIADFYDEEVDVAVAAMTSLMEPLMMIVIGGVCGGMVIAMYLPIFSMAGQIQE